MSNKIKSLINENLARSIKLSLKKIFSKLNIYKPKRIHHNKKSHERRKIYSKDDLMAVILSQGNTKSRSRSNSISYDLCSTSNIITPDKKTWCPVKNINIKVNVFWREEYKKEQIDLTILRTSSYGSFKKAISEKLGYGISSNFAILYHTKKYDSNNTMRRILLDYWIKNKMLWFVDNDFIFRKHLLLWKDYIEITAVRKSII
ncbi:unnamed protein product [Rhizophagus irregularis]|nr:unnamed protein product [Rhizophagus irregularis]CAB4416819.1 unnamed protein product [Rhizophagus irregularis]